MLADEVRPPWRAALAIAVTLAASSWLSRSPCVRNDDAPGPVTYVHVKLAAEGLRPAAVTTSELMFTQLALDTHDARARWIRVPAMSAREAAALVRVLATDPTVEQAFVAPEVTLPDRTAFGEPLPTGPHELALLTDQPLASDDERCPITTPSFESYQGYLGPAPHGIDAPAAWNRGYRGGGVRFADIEGGWNVAHEDLPGDRITHVAGKPINDQAWRAHGTAVLGQLVGRDNGKGVVGIAPDIDRVFTASIDGIAVANAIDTAAKHLRAGDVLLIELQGGGPRGRYLPMEYWDDCYDAIAAATKRGVVIIEAAGNGAEDLDHPAYQMKFDRRKRDSGAIMVGAGGPPRAGFSDRERLEFSNYGGRVDVQGWGRKVATLDYGDLQSCDDDAGAQRAARYTDRHYTGEFSGTSSASPIVAGAAVLLEGIARHRGRILTPLALRELLVRTGTPQTGNTAQQIGPRPDLGRAISALD